MGTQDFFSKHWLAAVLILLFALNATWMVRLAGRADPPEEGHEAPQLDLPTLALRDGSLGARFELQSVRGKVVLLDFWATWCPPCIDAIPELVALYSQYASRGLVVVGVANDSPRPEVARIAREHEIPYPIVLDVEGRIAERYDVRNLPTLFIIDRRGVIRAIDASGPKPKETLARMIEPFL